MRTTDAQHGADVRGLAVKVLDCDVLRAAVVEDRAEASAPFDVGKVQPRLRGRR
jgi:hypothetical protein